MSRRGGTAALLVGLAALCAGAAQAQEDSRDARIAALEQQLKGLAAELAELKAGQAAAPKTLPPPQPKVTLTDARPQIVSADGAFRVALRSAVQLDAARYDVSPLRTDNDLSSGTNFRRARLGVDGTAFRDWNFAVWGEFGGTGGEQPVLNQAWVEYAGFRPIRSADPLRLRVGAWATPAGLEDATPYTESLFLERAAVAELVRGFAGGDGRSSVGAFLNGKRWYASAVLTGALVGTPSPAEFGEQEGYLARIALNPLHGKDYDLHLGANVSGVLRPADTAAGPATIRAVRLRERPELRVDGTRLVDTGAIPADGLTALGLEAGASVRNLFLQGEWYRIAVDRAGTAVDPSFSGWYVQAAWTLTGERHVWSGASGGFRGIRPSAPFDLSKGQLGAFEAAVRYSMLDLNDEAGLPGQAAPGGGIRGGRQRITTAGLNWYPNSVVRFLLDYQWTDVRRLNAAGAEVGESVKALAVRSQFAF